MEQNAGPIFGNEGEQYTIYPANKPHQVPPYGLGQELWLTDGRKYRFGRAGSSTTCVPGKIYQSEVPDGNFDTLAIPAPSALAGSVTRSSRLPRLL